MIKIVTPEENRIPLQTMLPEAMISCTGDWGKDFEWCDVLVIGPGIGMTVKAADKVEFFLKKAKQEKKQVVLDADGLNLLAENPKWKNYLGRHVILTPHMGEMSRLTGKSIRELKDVLRKWKAQGKTIVIAEHRLYYLMDIADRVLYMQGGQIKENLSISDFKKKSTGELHALGLRTLQSEDFSKMQSTVCATKQLYIRDFEVSYKNASGGKTKKRKVLDISDLMIPQGSVVGVVGNNGAGKTTFANNLCGLLKTAKGCMSMNGKTYMANQRIKTCYMVMQDVNHQLFTESVMDEILLSLDNSDEEKATHEAESIMESLHISEFRDAHPMSLSGGQKQRVLLARALCAAGELLILDEPVTGLDPIAAGEMYNLIKLVNLCDGISVIMVSHDIHEAVRYATHILHLGHRQLFFGTAAEYRESDLARRFLGGNRV